MRVAVVGGGPAGLFAAALLASSRPDAEVTVWEREQAGRPAGFGLVFSDAALADLDELDAELRRELVAAAVSWTDITICRGGERMVAGGHGFAALPRARLLTLLTKRCADAGVDLRFGAAAPADLVADLVIAADGVNSAFRAATVEEGRCEYVWLSAAADLGGFEFHIVETPVGVVTLHCYPHAPGEVSVVAEGLALPGPAELARLVSGALGGAAVTGADAPRQRFRTVTAERWWSGNTVLIGDAAHTTHFSTGAGAKLAFEDAACLVRNIDDLQAYADERRPAVESAQRAARASQEWFENVGQYLGQAPLRFAFNLLTRSRRVTDANLAVRDPAFADRVRRSFSPDGRPPMFAPLRLRGVELPNRVVVSPMAMYSATEGLIDDFHLVHLGAKALGGAGLVMTEMTAVSAAGRATPGCAGLYTDEHEDAWRRVVEFVHGRTPAKIGVQLGHAGRKGATKPMWEGLDEPLDDGAWPLLAPSPLPYLPHGQAPAEMTRADMAQVRGEFVAATTRAARAGFDLLELHCAHGYLLSSFLTPLSNRRTDSFGGSSAARLRFPLEVLDAVRGAWPADRPLSVRISATDWAEGGIDGDEAVELARAFAAAGADLIDVSTGGTTAGSAPRFGRGWQVPYADRIRNVVGVPTIAVGAISSADDVNSLLLAGRADLCAIGRPFLHNPAWALHAAAEQGYDVPWPAQFEAGRRPPPAARRAAAGAWRAAGRRS